ncbi:MAG: ribosomal protein S18-alanine N-acetyltransferase [Deltaproteobacteria bacterium]|nr:ribosomal protein S18-alanine N-acetyltransferase [Deltaproteobacteria bacterium]
MVEGYILREMEKEDINRILEIERESFRLPWSRALFLDEFTRDYSHTYVVCDREKGEVQGFIIFWVLFDECHILNISVAKAMRRRGLGEKLMQRCEKIANNKGASYLYLEVREGNQPAINLYGKLGFRFVGLRRGYYTDTGEDGWVMIKNVKKKDK